MRILSQDGMIDVNYNLGNLSIASGKCEDVERASIYFHSCSCANATRLAEYTSLEKARKAMEMLRNAYSPNIEIKEPIQKEMPKPRSGDWFWSVTEPKVEVLDNFYFQFPTDDEVEV